MMSPPRRPVLHNLFVAGHRSEPSLRFVPDDVVSENARSPARYLNRDRDGTAAVPDDADAAAPLQWQRVADGDRHAFVAVAATATAMVLRGPTDDRWVGLARPLTVLVAIAALANVVRPVDDTVAVPATTGERIALVTAAAIGLTAIVAPAAWAWSGSAGGLLALGVAGVLTMLLFASDSVAQLSSSQLATELPTWVRRWTVAASFAITIPAFLSAGAAARNHVRRARRPRQPRIGEPVAV